MTTDDFRDAEDNEDWARPDDATVSSDDAGGAATVPVERPRLQAPPLKLDGFVPSAFSTGERQRGAGYVDPRQTAGAACSSIPATSCTTPMRNFFR